MVKEYGSYIEAEKYAFVSISSERLSFQIGLDLLHLKANRLLPLHEHIV